MSSTEGIGVEVKSQFIEEQSEPSEDRYAFAYTIVITNNTSETVRLLSHHLMTTDGNEQTLEQHGEGVTGEQPYIPTGKTYEYTIGTLLTTAVGTVKGSYQLITTSGQFIDAPIPVFSLCNPKTLH